MSTPRVDSITLKFSKPRKKPQVGDEKTVRGVVYVRQMKMIRQNGKVIGSDCTGGRQRYEWVAKNVLEAEKRKRALLAEFSPEQK